MVKAHHPPTHTVSLMEGTYGCAFNLGVVGLRLKALPHLTNFAANSFHQQHYQFPTVN